MNNLNLIVVVLAGGEGTRLWPLTARRSKPAVPIGGKFRLIDIPLSNMANSSIRNAVILTQGKDKSFDRHIKNNWPSYPHYHISFNIISPQKVGRQYKGDADAVRQVLSDLLSSQADYILIVPGDHLLKMDYYKFAEETANNQADAAIAVIPQPISKADQLGSLKLEKDKKIKNFQEKNPQTSFVIDDCPDYFYASMGIYAFKPTALNTALKKKGNLFGKQIIPDMINEIDFFGYQYEKHNHIPEIIKVFQDNSVKEIYTSDAPDSLYWRDVGTINEYHEANMDLVGIDPKFNLYGTRWPFFTSPNHIGPAKIIQTENRACLESAIIGEGSVLSNLTGRSLVVSSHVYIDRSHIDDTVIFDHCNIQRCRIKNAIIDKQVRLIDMEIGYNEEKDQAMGIFIDPSSKIRVVPKFYSSQDPSTWPLSQEL